MGEGLAQRRPAPSDRAGAPARRVDRAALAVAAIALAMVGFALLLGLDLSSAAREQQRWVRHTINVQLQAERVDSALAELGRRVLLALAVGEGIDVASFDRAEIAVQAELAQLQGLVADNPSQLAAARALDESARAHIDAMRAPAAGPSPSLRVELAAWRARVDAVGRQLDDVIEAESDLLRERQQAFDDTLRRQTLVIVIAIVLAVLAIGWALLQSGRLARQRAAALVETRRHAAALTALNAELEQRVQQRTAALEQLGRVQRLRNDLSRELLAALDEPDTGRVVARWREHVLASGVVDWVDVRLAEAAREAADAPPPPAPDGATTLPLPPDHGVVRFRLAATGRDAQGVGARAANVTEDLGAWLELRRQRTARAAAERERDEREAQLNALFEQTPIGLTLLDNALRIVRINEAAASIGGHRVDEVTGLLLTELPRAETGAPLWPLIQRARHGGERIVNRRVELPIGGRGWEPGTMLVSLVPLMRADGVRIGFAAVTMDITDAERSRRRLRELARQLMLAEETERRALARDLHDDFGQRLTAIKLGLQLARRAVAEPAAAALIDDAVEVAAGCIAQVRDRAVRLRPPQLDELGLAAALRAHAEQEGTRAQLSVRVEMALGDVEPLPDWSGHVFRIVQEALRNAIEHGRPTEVAVELRRSPDGVLLTITDNGVGVGVTSRQAGTGMLSMRERTELLGGEFRLLAVQPHGTRVECRWPLAVVFAPGREAALGR